jgi:pimeloyl-ACP methyl ester carboxylesterase
MYGPPYLAYYTDRLEFDEAADLVREHLDEDGPFDGVFAFSQGCHLAAALMSATPHNESNGQLFRFAVFVGAAPSPKFDLKDGKRERSLDVPVLHVIGRNDRHRLQSQEFVSMHSDASDSVVLEHDGGHHVPIDVVVRYTITRYMKNMVSGGPVAA